jgi:hypothetical protein
MLKQAGNFIRKNKKPIIAGGVMVTGYIIYRKAKRAQDRQKVYKDLANFKKSPGTSSINVQEIAQQLGLDFGFAYPVYHPGRWTENDTDIMNTLLRVPPALMPALNKAYADLYERNLQQDAQKYLGDLYPKVSHLFTGKKITTPSTGKATDWIRRVATNATIVQ